MFDEYNFIVSTNLRKIMQEKKIQQKEIRLLCQKTAATVSRWLDGTAPIPLKYIMPICQLLEVSPNEVFGYKDNLSNEEKSVLKAYRKDKKFKDIADLLLKK